MVTLAWSSTLRRTPNPTPYPARCAPRGARRCKHQTLGSCPYPRPQLIDLFRGTVLDPCSSPLQCQREVFDGCDSIIDEFRIHTLAPNPEVQAKPLLNLAGPAARMTCSIWAFANYPMVDHTSSDRHGMASDFQIAVDKSLSQLTDFISAQAEWEYPNDCTGHASWMPRTSDECSKAAGCHLSIASRAQIRTYLHTRGEGTGTDPSLVVIATVESQDGSERH